MIIFGWGSCQNENILWSCPARGRLLSSQGLVYFAFPIFLCNLAVWVWSRLLNIYITYGALWLFRHGWCSDSSLKNRISRLHLRSWRRRCGLLPFDWRGSVVCSPVRSLCESQDSHLGSIVATGCLYRGWCWCFCVGMWVLSDPYVHRFDKQKLGYNSASLALVRFVLVKAIFH